MGAQGKGHVLEDIDVGEQGAALEEHAHALAQPIQLGVPQGIHLLAKDPHHAMAGQQLAADESQQGGLARPARPHHRRDLAGGDLHVHAIEDLPCTAVERHAFQMNGRFGHRSWSDIKERAN